MYFWLNKGHGKILGKQVTDTINYKYMCEKYRVLGKGVTDTMDYRATNRCVKSAGSTERTIQKARTGCECLPGCSGCSHRELRGC